MILATAFATHNTGPEPLSPAPLHRAVCIALLPWLHADGALVLEGSVQRHGGRLRIHARLVDRETRRVRDSFRFDGASTPNEDCTSAYAHFAAALAARVTALGLSPLPVPAQGNGADHLRTGC